MILQPAARMKFSISSGMIILFPLAHWGPGKKKIGVAYSGLDTVSNMQHAKALSILLNHRDNLLFGNLEDPCQLMVRLCW